MVEKRDEDVMVEKGAMLSKITWIMLVVLYFFPLITVDYPIIGSYSLTGISSTFGLSKMGQKVYQGNHMFVVLILIPVIALVLSFLCKRLYDIAKYSLIGAIVQLFILITYLIGLPKIYQDMYILIEFNAIFYMEILLVVALIVLSIYLLSNIQMVPETDEDMAKKGERFIILYCLSIVAIILIITNIEKVENLLLKLFFEL